MTRAIARSRSKIQYAAVAKAKKIPIRTSNAFRPMVTAPCTTEPAAGTFFRRFWTATRMSCLIPVDFFASRLRSDAEVGTEPIACVVCLTAGGTTSQRKRAMTPTITR